MLELELGGRKVTTTDEKQIMKINGNPIEIERIGDSIYVNRQAINLIVIDAKNKWKSVMFLAILIPVVAGAFYLMATNQDLLMQGGDAVIDFVHTTITPTIEGAVDAAGGLINGNETDSGGK